MIIHADVGWFGLIWVICPPWDFSWESSIYRIIPNIGGESSLRTSWLGTCLHVFVQCTGYACWMIWVFDPVDPPLHTPSRGFYGESSHIGDWGFPMGATPSHHSCLEGIFHEINPVQLRVAPMETTMWENVWCSSKSTVYLPSHV